VTRWLRGTLAVLAALWCGLGSHVPGAPSPARAGDAYTPLVMSVPSTPRWFTGSDGRVHLVHELVLTNGFNVPVTVSSVTVNNLAGRPLARLEGDALAASMTLLADPGMPSVTVPGSGVGVVWLDVSLSRPSDVPRSITHTLTVMGPPGVPVPAAITSTSGATSVDRRSPVTLGPPLRGAGWVAVGSCCDGPHRRSVQPVNGKLFLGQRFAIDFNGADAEGRFVVGDPDVNESWTFYGKPVLAVADAKVVAAADRFPDQIPNHPEPVTIEEADGNYVILALGAGRYAFYAHLVPGSIRVEVGDRVRRGQIIGALGNSGSSTGPHLHFQVMNAPSALASDGLPFVIDEFRLVGKIPPLDDALAASLSANDPVPIDTEGAGVRHRQLPMGRDIVDFR
jgi:hypothetical protein